MSGHEFFVPSAAWGGTTPRLALPHVDAAAPIPWLGAYVADGNDLRRLIESLEPLLVALYVAGYTVPEIAVVAPDGGARLATTTARVELGDPSTWPGAPPPEPPSADVVGVLLSVRPVILAAPAVGPSSAPLPELVAPASTWVALWLSATDGASLRAAADLRAVEQSHYIGGVLDGAEATAGLARLYDPDQWAMASKEQLADHELAVRDLVRTLPMSAAEALAHELDRGARPTVFQYRSLSQLVCDLGAAEGDVRSEADCRALLTNLRSALAGLAGTPEYGDLSLTTALLDLETRGLVDILGPPADDDVTEILEVLDVPPTVRLAPEQIAQLCTYLAQGPGQVTDEVAERLAIEHRHVAGTALAGTIVRAFVDICLVAEIVPDQVESVGRSFERYVDVLRVLMGQAAADALPGDPTPAVQAVWQAWSPLLEDPAVSARMLYGAVRLFTLSADVDLAAQVTVLALDVYAGLLASMSAHWRTEAGTLELSTRADLAGWGEHTFINLCQSVWRLRGPVLAGSLTAEEWARAHAALATAQGIAPFSPDQVDAVERRFGELLGEEFAHADPTTPTGQLADVFALLAQVATDASVAARCDIAAVGPLLDAILAEPECRDLLPERRRQAAFDVLGDVAAVGAAMQEWVLSAPTQAYLATLDRSRRDVEEARLLEALGRIAPERVEHVLVENAAVRLGSELDIVMADVDEDELTAEIAAAYAARSVPAFPATESTARETAKLVKSGVKLMPASTLGLFQWGFDSIIGEAKKFQEVGALSDETLAFLRFVRDETLDPQVGVMSRELMPTHTRQLGNAGAVAAAFIAVHQLSQSEWTTNYVTNVGLVRDVVNGALPAVDLLADFTHWLMGGTAWEKALSSQIQLLAELSVVLSGGSALISIITNGVAAYKAYDSGDHVGAGLYASASMANGVLLYAICVTGSSTGSAVLPLLGMTVTVPGLGLLAAAITVGAVVWKLWIKPWMDERRQAAAFQALVTEHRLLYAENVYLLPPTDDTILTRRVEAWTFVTTATPLGVLAGIGGLALDLPDTYDDGLVTARTVVTDVEGEGQEARSPMPGRIFWVEGDPVGGLDVPASALWGLVPLLDIWMVAAPGDVVQEASVRVGDWVEAGTLVATVTDGTETVELRTEPPGRVVALVPTGGIVGDDHMVARVRPEERDLFVEFAEAEQP